ncbi:MAG: hypothetical protein AB7O77_03575 [Phycisphaerales bacterium]
MKRFVLAAVGLAVAASSAHAQFSFTNPGPVNSGGAIGSADNGLLTFTYSGPSFTPGSITLEGDLTSVIAGTFASEARVRVTSPGGAFYNSLQWTATGSFTTLHLGPATQIFSPMPASGSVGTWSFEFFESFDDGAGADSTWSNLSIGVNAFVPPTPPACINMGDVSNSSAVYATPDMNRLHIGGAVTWYCFTLNDAINNGVGSWLDIDTEGSNFDTEIGLYDVNGTLIATDDDDGSGTQSELSFGQISPTRTIGTAVGGNGRDGSLVPGTYYLAVAGFNATYGAGFSVTTTSTNTTGLAQVNIRTNIPAPGSVALLGLAGLIAARRRRA